MATRIGPEVDDFYVKLDGCGWLTLPAEVDELIGMELVERRVNDKWSGYHWMAVLALRFRGGIMPGHNRLAHRRRSLRNA